MDPARRICRAGAMKPPVHNVPAGELLKLLDELAAFSVPGPGVTRLLYTPEWCGAQLFLQQRMKSLGLEVRQDRVGNIYGRLSGSGAAAAEQVILTGSHIDTVVNGGRYDGAYGIAAAVTVLHYLQQTFGRPLRSLEVVSFSEEEGSRFPLTFWGSGNVTGLYDGSSREDIADAEGVTLGAAMKACGLGGEAASAGVSAETAAAGGKDYDDAGADGAGAAGTGSVDTGSAVTGPAGSAAVTISRPLRSDIAAYLELHIEQGIVLERSARQIGVVQAIAGQRRYRVTVSGTANHAGTTPMGLRRDALAGSAEMLLALERSAAEEGDPLVATTGRLEVYPGTPNVIPGEVQFTLDIRHSDAGILERYCPQVLEEFAAIAARRGLKLEIQPVLMTTPAPMDKELCAALEQVCLEQGKTYLRMVSGAGHDAQLFAPLCPAAMIFVPSRGGISHAPDEYTPPEELAAGMQVLAAILYKLAYTEEGVIEDRG
ncbi:Zn-dependent hydrolase [Paenibacillus sp. MMS20-IR301]|uniref:Zn-dependent hydrolase n=1 Tax=Paenibacillus sp. MMS20-IR301 TaxID=2895946 RepID=UPI0028EA3828|nr:Zn-dependent hydrolase [Paenibacillus sp. MMS20-IR301]WNS40882.1 Zn-dependent hydrolase [Paenibacillus sp. MMS20-IR301]